MSWLRSWLNQAPLREVPDPDQILEWHDLYFRYEQTPRGRVQIAPTLASLDYESTGPYDVMVVQPETHQLEHYGWNLSLESALHAIVRERPPAKDRHAFARDADHHLVACWDYQTSAVIFHATNEALEVLQSIDPIAAVIWESKISEPYPSDLEALLGGKP